MGSSHGYTMSDSLFWSQILAGLEWISLSDWQGIYLPHKRSSLLWLELNLRAHFIGGLARIDWQRTLPRWLFINCQMKSPDTSKYFKRECRQTTVGGFSAEHSWPRLPWGQNTPPEAAVDRLQTLQADKLTSWQGDWPWDGFPRASSTKEPSPVWELFGNSSRHLDQRRHYTCNQFVQYFFHLTESSNAATKPLQGDQLLLFFYEFSVTDSKMAINCKTKPLSDTLHRNILIFWCDKKVWWKILFFSETRSYAALRAADLDWIVGPGYSLGRVHSGETMKNQPGTMTN